MEPHRRERQLRTARRRPRSARDERADATRIAEDALGHPAGPAEVSRYWTSRASAFVRAQPASWLKLMARKTALALSADEFADTESQQVYADSSWLLRALTPFSSVLFPRGAGIAHAAPRAAPLCSTRRTHLLRRFVAFNVVADTDSRCCRSCSCTRQAASRT